MDILELNSSNAGHRALIERACADGSIVYAKISPTQKRSWYVAGVKEGLFVILYKANKPEDQMLCNKIWVKLEG